MKVIPFNHQSLNEILKVWLKAREMDPNFVEEIPYDGFIAFNDNMPICAGFIRRCEGWYGLIDSLITNPTQPSEIRDKAIDLLVEALLKQAKELKLKQLIAYSVDKNTLMRSERHGFKKLDYTVIMKDLAGDK